MLGAVASKYNKNNPTERYIYYGKWVSADDRKIEQMFKFALVQDDNVVEADFNKLSGLQGNMKIKTKSTIPFSPDDMIFWLGCGNNQKYIVENIDGNRKEQGELAMMHFNLNGNMPIYITLKRAG